MSVPSNRSAYLRIARTRALARLRANNDAEYQALMDEEIARMGLEPRLGVMPYRPRNTELREEFDQQKSN